MRRLAALLGLLVLLGVLPARAEKIEVREVRLRGADGALVLDADFDFELTPRLGEVVANGVPLYFRVEFELTRPRWYWFDESASSMRLQLRLSYHALSRQYRLSTGLLQQTFASLEEALNVLRRVRGWPVVERAAALSDAHYDVALRMRLDTALLPRPFQLSAVTSRELHLDSEWKRFSVRPSTLPVTVR